MINQGVTSATKHQKNGSQNLYNQFLFCNSFLLFVRYLHGQIIKTTIETTGFALKQRHRIETNTLYTKVVSIVSIVVKKESCKDMFFRHDMLSDMKTCAEWLQHPRSCIIFVKRTASRIHPMHNFAKFV